LLPTLQSFATIYRRSASARRDAVKDYTLDYEIFLRTAGLDDGDEREIAEKELLLAETSSGGLFRIDRHPRSGSPQRLRLAREGGEAWLFSQTGDASPSDSRQILGAFFDHAKSLPVPAPWASSWTDWFSSLATRALSGESVHPFKRDDPQGNETLLQTLAGVLNWKDDSLVRYASSLICGDSKKLQSLDARLIPALEAITGRSSLEDFGILRKPRSVTFHGPLILRRDIAVLDFSSFPAPHTLSESNLVGATVTTTAPFCLTVENEDVFHELAKRNPGILLVQSSFPGSAALRFFGLLPADLPFHHFGDSDPAGFDILRDLRSKTGRDIHPFLMDHRPGREALPLSPEENHILDRLIGMNLLGDLRDELQAKLRAGDKGDFEQESIPIPEVIHAIHGLMPESDH
jgi:hypothetical protein